MSDAAPFLLTEAELATLTGRKYPAWQRKWLNENGYLYDIGADNKPKVARAYVEARLNGLHSGKRQPKLHFPDAKTAQAR